MAEEERIYLVGPGGLETAARREFPTEDELQTLIADHPEIVAGPSQVGPGPTRWMLVSREVGVPDREGGGGRWALEHLLLDEHGIPSFLEVKRGSNTELRRRVVGQMMDYAANGLEFWPVGLLKGLLERRRGVQGAHDEVCRLLGIEPDSAAVDEAIAAYWRSVEHNLRSGRCRLLFVADRIPDELGRIIQFLNGQMQWAEVLGVELTRYGGAGTVALVPRVLGRMGRQEPKPGSRNSPSTNESAFLEACPEWARAFFRDALAKAAERGLMVSWNARSFTLRHVIDGTMASLFYGYAPATNGYPEARVEGYLSYIPEPERMRAREHLEAAAEYTATTDLTYRLLLSGPSDVDAARNVLGAVFRIVEELG